MTKPKIIFNMLEGFDPIKNILGAGDPNVHKVDGQWWMFFGGFQRNFTNNLFSASLPKGEPLSTDMQWQVTMDPNDPKNALPLIKQPEKEEWDHFGLHEPCFVEGKKQNEAGEWVSCRRIYYTGRTGKSTFGSDTTFSIGMLEMVDGEWQRRKTPVITGDERNPSALGPKVIYDGKKWRIWYRAEVEEPVKGKKPFAEIYYSESDDGINWKSPKSFFGREDEFAHTYILKRSDGSYEMLLSKIPNLYGESFYPEQKLWISTAKTPSGNRADWSEPKEILAAKGGEVWYANGFFGSSICEADAKGEEGEQYVFFASVRESINWLTFSIKRLLTFKKPPIPAPFYFAVGFFKIDKDK